MRQRRFAKVKGIRRSDGWRHQLTRGIHEICSAASQVDRKAMRVDHKPTGQLDMVVALMRKPHGVENRLNQDALVLAGKSDIFPKAPSSQPPLVLLSATKSSIVSVPGLTQQVQPTLQRLTMLRSCGAVACNPSYCSETYSLPGTIF